MFTDFASMTATANIDDGSARCLLKQTDEVVRLIVGMTNEIRQVLAFERHAEDGKTMFVTRGICWLLAQFFADIIHDLWCSCSGKCQNGHIRQQLTNVGYFQIGRTEVISPL